MSRQPLSSLAQKVEERMPPEDQTSQIKLSTSWGGLNEMWPLHERVSLKDYTATGTVTNEQLDDVTDDERRAVSFVERRLLLNIMLQRHKNNNPRYPGNGIVADTENNLKILSSEKKAIGAERDLKSQMAEESKAVLPEMFSEFPQCTLANTLSSHYSIEDKMYGQDSFVKRDACHFSLNATVVDFEDLYEGILTALKNDAFARFRTPVVFLQHPKTARLFSDVKNGSGFGPNASNVDYLHRKIDKPNSKKSKIARSHLLYDLLSQYELEMSDVYPNYENVDIGDPIKIGDTPYVVIDKRARLNDTFEFLLARETVALCELSLHLRLVPVKKDTPLLHCVIKDKDNVVGAIEEEKADKTLRHWEGEKDEVASKDKVAPKDVLLLRIEQGQVPSNVDMTCHTFTVESLCKILTRCIDDKTDFAHWCLVQAVPQFYFLYLELMTLPADERIGNHDILMKLLRNLIKTLYANESVEDFLMKCDGINPITFEESGPFETILPDVQSGIGTKLTNVCMMPDDKWVNAACVALALRHSTKGASEDMISLPFHAMDMISSNHPEWKDAVAFVSGLARLANEDVDVDAWKDSMWPSATAKRKRGGDRERTFQEKDAKRRFKDAERLAYILIARSQFKNDIYRIENYERKQKSWSQVSKSVERIFGENASGLTNTVKELYPEWSVTQKSVFPSTTPHRDAQLRAFCHGNTDMSNYSDDSNFLSRVLNIVGRYALQNWPRRTAFGNMPHGEAEFKSDVDPTIQKAAVQLRSDMASFLVMDNGSREVPEDVRYKGATMRMDLCPFTRVDFGDNDVLWIDDRLLADDFDSSWVAHAPLICIPSIIRSMQQHDYHSVYFEGHNAMGQLEGFATVLCIRREELRYYVTKYMSPHTYFVVLPDRAPTPGQLERIKSLKTNLVAKIYGGQHAEEYSDLDTAFLRAKCTGDESAAALQKLESYEKFVKSRGYSAGDSKYYAYVVGDLLLQRWRGDDSIGQASKTAGPDQYLVIMDDQMSPFEHQFLAESKQSDIEYEIMECVRSLEDQNHISMDRRDGKGDGLYGRYPLTHAAAFRYATEVLNISKAGLAGFTSMAPGKPILKAKVDVNQIWVYSMSKMRTAFPNSSALVPSFAAAEDLFQHILLWRSGIARKQMQTIKRHKTTIQSNGTAGRSNFPLPYTPIWRFLNLERFFTYNPAYNQYSPVNMGNAIENALDRKSQVTYVIPMEELYVAKGNKKKDTAKKDTAKSYTELLLEYTDDEAQEIERDTGCHAVKLHIPNHDNFIGIIYEVELCWPFDKIIMLALPMRAKQRVLYIAARTWYKFDAVWWRVNQLFGYHATWAKSDNPSSVWLNRLGGGQADKKGDDCLPLNTFHVYGKRHKFTLQSLRVLRYILERDTTRPTVEETSVLTRKERKELNKELEEKQDAEKRQEMLNNKGANSFKMGIIGTTKKTRRTRTKTQKLGPAPPAIKKRRGNALALYNLQKAMAERPDDVLVQYFSKELKLKF